MQGLDQAQMSARNLIYIFQGVAEAHLFEPSPLTPHIRIGGKLQLGIEPRHTIGVGGASSFDLTTGQTLPPTGFIKYRFIVT